MASPGMQQVRPWARMNDLPPEQIVFGRSAPMQVIRRKIEKIASANVPVLIQGSSGTGKGVVAHYIHTRSATPAGPFVKVNCAAIPSTLLESELFGSEVGAFTGAHVAKPGRAEMADGGTLFLDGIDEIDFHLQAKLLQLLQDGQFCRIGGQKDITVHARVICATGRQLEQAVAAGTFRQDLYYRINVVNVELPPLRARVEDIPDLVNYFLEQLQKRHNSKTGPLSAPLLRLLEKHPWPGNIRELENLVERYIILGSEETITAELLHWDHAHAGSDLPVSGPIHLKKVTRQAVLELERKIILSVLEANHWNRKRTASELKISYRALLYKIRQAGLPPRRSPRSPGASEFTSTAVNGD